MPSQITCPVQDDDCNSISSLSICYVPCCSFSLSSLQSANDSEVPINRFKPADIIANMQTRAAVKKQHDDGDSVNWDTESIFDPPQRNSKSHELDSKLGAKPTGIPSSSNPLFTPLGVDDTEKAEADTLSFKQSLSNDLEDDSFSDYLGMNQHSLKGSPMARSPMAHDLQLNIPFPSPLHDMDDKDAQIMNEALGMSFDFNENPAAMGLSSSPPSGRMGFNFPRLKPSSSSFSLSTPPRNSSSSMDRTREHKDASSAAAFPVDARNQLSSASNYGTPTHRFSQGRAIYHVAGKSPSKYEPTSHSTPERSYEDNKGNSEKSPEFSPPRSKLRTESRTHDGPKSGSSNSHSHHRNDILPVKNCSTDFCVTPSPPHSQSRISKAVSDESNTPPAMNHYPPSTTHPMSYHGSLSGTPASASFPNSGEAGLPHPPSYTSPNWSNSLHLAPLPPFVSSNGAPPSTPQWHHVNGAPPQANAPAAPYGYPNYSPYYPQQTTPPRYPTIQSTSKESSAEATHWRHKHHLLYQFRAKFGHCRVPPGYGVGTEYEGLFEWVMDQHYQHQRMMNGEVTTMTPTRARVLSDIGVVFAQVPNDHHPKVVTSGPMERKAPSSWSNWMSQLAEYRKRHGDCDVPLKYPANPCLGTFVNRQRTEYRKMLAKKPSSMTNEKIEELNKLGFTWDVRESHTSWEERFEELKAYKRENGHANVPKVYSKNPSLGYWVSCALYRHLFHCSHVTQSYNPT
jgi:hypothetical protein